MNDARSRDVISLSYITNNNIPRNKPKILLLFFLQNEKKKKKLEKLEKLEKQIALRPRNYPRPHILPKTPATSNQ